MAAVSHSPRTGASSDRGGKALALGLQGGGAHGAYGWGVLERLLDVDVTLTAVSGASAGALNGAALVAGYASGGRKGAADALATLWRTVSAQSPLRTLDSAMFGPLLEPFVRQVLEASKLLSPVISPLVPNLRSMAPLRAVVESAIDMEAVRSAGALPLHVSATRVNDGTTRLFSNPDIDIDALMASACLPDLFDPVEIDGETYWDGGFSANPALDPLLPTDGTPVDLLIVQITPFGVKYDGKSLTETMTRISDIGFNACLMRDLRALAELQKLIRESPHVGSAMPALADTNIHLLSAAPDLAERGPTSKFDTRPSKLDELRVLGQQTADAWLKENRDKLGAMSTLVVSEEQSAA